jgi:DNA-binding LacI/PurR family transcriptional regulator
MGKIALETLVDKIKTKSKQAVNRRIILDPSLIIRQTS